MIPSKGPALLLPPAGVLWRDFVQVLAHLPKGNFNRTAPGPFLLELPPRILKDPPALGGDGLQRRLDAIQAEDLGSARVFSLAPRSDGPLVLGRHPKLAHVVLPERTISKRHARMERTRAGWMFEDLGGSNGSWLEGMQIAANDPVLLESGHLLRLSTYRCVFLAPNDLHYVAVEERASEPTDARSLIANMPREGKPLRDLVAALGETTRKEFLATCSQYFLIQVPLELDVQKEELSEDLPAEATLAISRTRILKLRRSRNISQAWVHVLSRRKEGNVLGRSGGVNDLVLDERSVSKRHAKIQQIDGHWQLVDLGSHNGTWVEGKKVEIGLSVPLHPGQTVLLSSYRALFLAPRQVYGLADKIQTQRLKKKKL